MAIVHCNPCDPCGRRQAFVLPPAPPVPPVPERYALTVLVPANQITLPGHILSPVRVLLPSDPNLPLLTIAKLAVGDIYNSDTIDPTAVLDGTGWFVAKAILGTLPVEGGGSSIDPYSIVEIWSCGDTFTLNDIDPTLRPYWEVPGRPGIYVGTTKTGEGLPSPSLPSLEPKDADVGFISSQLVAYRIMRYATKAGQFEAAFRVASEVPQVVTNGNVRATRLVGTDQARYTLSQTT